MIRHVAALALLLTTVTACGGDKDVKLNPSATASSLTASAPKSAAARKFSIDTGSSHVMFAMEAPLEKIRGKAENGVSGELQIDPADLKKTTGAIAVDLGKLELFQRTKGDSGEFTEETKNEKQNEHATAWLQIDKNTDEPARTKNKRVEFAIRDVLEISASDLSKLTGDERKVTAKVKGEFLLHGRTAEKEANLEITFKMKGDQIASVAIKTKEPMAIGLAEFEVRPRDTFGKIAQKGLGDLAPKVAKDAPIELDLVATPVDGPGPAAPAPSAAPAAPESAAPAASASAAPSPSAVPASSAKK